jgi:cell division protease FtsH
MSDSENKNRDLKIKQQKNVFIRNIIICVAVLLVFTLIFWAVARNSSGTEISFNEFQTELSNGNVKEIDFNQQKIQIYYVNGESHWLYNRSSAENTIMNTINDLYSKTEDGTFTGTIPKVVFGTTTTISVLSILYPIVLIAGIIIMIVIVLKQVKGANNKSFDFVKNRARIYPSKTKFSDVAGEDEEKAELEDVVDFLKNPQKYVELGAKIPKGVLLVGPPGTGKTLLARAVAGEANVPFFTISGSDFMELFVGVGASRVRDLFETAKKAKPCIIFIDEIDAVGRQRGAGLGGGNDEREQTLNQLLVQMDGFEDNEGIIVMAATNRVDILDPALLRPGRFDRRVNISIPDIKGREEILKVHARNKPLDETVNLKTIARITSGFTGAEIENLLNEAAILVAKENRKKITEEDIQKSMMKVTLGPQKRSRVIDEKEKKNTAIHEAGHAFVHKLAKITTPVQEVSIIPRGGAGGYTLAADDDHMMYYREELICKIQMLLGGITAEKLYVGDISTGASNDLKRATNIARRMVSEWGMSSSVGMVYCGSDDEVFIGRSYQEKMPYSENQASRIDDEVKNIIDECAKETERILTENKDKLMTMTDVLLEKETIYADEVDLIIQGKSKEEVIEFIDNHNKKNDGTTENKSVLEKEKVSDKPTEKAASENSEKIEENKENSEKITKNDANLIDDLIKIAEKREKENATKTDENVKEKAKKQKSTASKTTSKSKETSKETSKEELKDGEVKKTTKPKASGQKKTGSQSKANKTTVSAKKSTKKAETKPETKTETDSDTENK